MRLAGLHAVGQSVGGLRHGRVGQGAYEPMSPHLGEQAERRQLLAEVSGSSAKGVDTADRLEGQALREELA